MRLAHLLFRFASWQRGDVGNAGYVRSVSNLFGGQGIKAEKTLQDDDHELIGRDVVVMNVDPDRRFNGF